MMRGKTPDIFPASRGGECNERDMRDTRAVNVERLFKFN
jgi:hypothetical protein